MSFSMIWFVSACSSDDGLKIYNNKPEAIITSHVDGEELLEGVEYLLTGQVSDGNHSNEELTVVWSSSAQELCTVGSVGVDGVISCLASFEVSDTEIKLQVTDPEGESVLTSVGILVVETTAPEIELISPVANGSYYSDYLIPFSAIIQDVEDSPEQLLYSWESSIDGTLSISGEADSDGAISDYAMLSQGQHAITLRVEDTTGKVRTADVPIVVGGPNTEPACAIVQPTSENGFVYGENIVFEGTAFDEDINNSLLQVEWLSDQDGVFNTTPANTMGELNFIYDALSIGNHTITLRTEDENGAFCTDTIVLSIGTPPAITIDTPTSGDRFSIEENVLFSGTVADAEDVAGDLSVSWFSDLDGIFSTQGSDSSGNINFSYSGLSAGEHNITITVTDSDSLNATHNLILHINTPPSAPQIELNPQPAYTIDTLNLNVSQDPDMDGDSITYSYEWLKDGLLTNYTNANLPSSATSVDEEWTVRVIPNDGWISGIAGEASITISNSAPSVDAISITPTTAYNDTLLTCSAQISDADETLTPNYIWMVGNATYSGSTLNLSTTAAMPMDSVTCTATVQDSGGLNAVSSANTSIENRPPSVSSISLAPNMAYTDSLVECAGVVADDDGETPTTSVSWSVGSTQIGTGSTIQLDPLTVSPGDVLSCIITAEDAYLGTSSAVVTSTIENTDPVIGSVTLTPESPTQTQTLTCTSIATDIDGGTPTLTFAWSNAVTGATYQSTSTSSNSATLALASIQANTSDEIVCTVTATDSDGGSHVQSQGVIIISELPTFDSSAQITPSVGVYTNTLLTCSAVVTDPEDGVIVPSYEWFVGSLSLGTNQTYVVSAADTDVGDSITCVATAVDSAGNSITSTDDVIVENTVPVLTGPSLGTTTAYNDDVLTCSASIVDPDESLLLSYAWEVGGIPVGTISSLDLATTSAMPLDVVTCTVSATDASGIPVSGSASLTIENRPPTQPTVSISPVSPFAGIDDLVCSASGSLDDDGQTISYSYSWSSSLGQSGAGTTISASMTSDGEVWTCTVTPNDGIEDGSSVSSNVQVTSSGDCTLTWNPNDAAPDIQFSNDNFTVASLASWQSVRANAPKSSGKWYFEVELKENHNDFYFVGVASQSFNLNGCCLGSYGSWGYYIKQGELRGDGNISAQDAWCEQPVCTVGVAVDMDEGEIWWSMNGNWQSSNSTSMGSASFGNVSGTVYPAVSLALNDWDDSHATIHACSAEMLYGPPPGFSAWE